MEETFVYSEIYFNIQIFIVHTFNKISRVTCRNICRWKHKWRIQLIFDANVGKNKKNLVFKVEKYNPYVLGTEKPARWKSEPPSHVGLQLDFWNK